MARTTKTPSRGRRAARPATASEILAHNLRSTPRGDVETLTPIEEEKGATGTPNVGGYIIGEEYNKKLEGKGGIRIYDEMRRSSAQVQASLAVLKVPIKSAKPVFTPPASSDTTDQAIADACARMLLGNQKRWNSTLDHLLLRLESGVTALEKIWTLDKAFQVGDKTQAVIRPLRLAPRLPATFERFIADDDGSLQTLEQYAMKGGQMRTLQMPATDLIVSIHQKEGDNFWGRSVLRTSYMHWFYLMDAYRVGGVRLDRYGVGVPVAELAQDHKATKTELGKIERLLKALRVHEKAYFMLPYGVKVRIMVPEGKGGVDELPAIEHHSGMIARNVLAGFILESMKGDSIGSTRTETLKDFFSSALEAEAADIAGDLQEQLVVPFCEMNFNMAGRTAPTLTFTDVNDVDVKELADNLNTLTGGDFITPDDDLEDLLRKLMKLRPLRDDQKGRQRSFGKSTNAPPAGPTPEPPAPSLRRTTPGAHALAQSESCVSCNGTGWQRERSMGDPQGQLPCASCGGSGYQLAAKKYTDALSGRVFSREPSALEQGYLSLREIPDRLEMETQDLIQALSAIRRTQLATAAATIAKKDARNTGDFTDLRPNEITMTGLGDLEREIRAAQTRVAAFGAQQVRAELQRQGAPLPSSLRSRESYWAEHYYGNALLLAQRTLADTPDDPNDDPTAGASAVAATSSLVSSAKVTAKKLLDQWKTRVLETAIRLRRTGLRGDALRDAIVHELDDVIEQSVKGDATGEVNEAFGIGRATEASAQSDLIQDVVYSALMDVNTCEPCAELDGEVMAYGSPRYYETMPPYRKCLGNKGKQDACRCVHIFRYKANAAVA